MLLDWCGGSDHRAAIVKHPESERSRLPEAVANDVFPRSSTGHRTSSPPTSSVRVGAAGPGRAPAEFRAAEAHPRPGLDQWSGSARGSPLHRMSTAQAPWYRAAVAVPLAKRILCLAEDREAMMSCAPASGGSRASRSRPTDMRDKTYQSETRSMVRGRCGSDRQGDVPACHWALR